MKRPSRSAAKLEHPNCPGRGYLVERGLRLEIPLRLVPPVRARFSTGATRSTIDAHGEEHAPSHARDALRARNTSRRHRSRIRDFPRVRGKRPSLQRHLRRTRARRDQRHECVRQRHAPGPRQTDRTRDDEWRRARNLHESDVCHVQRQGGAQRQVRFAPAQGASRPCVRVRRRQ